MSNLEKDDKMEGGFAVVDRERLIEEETREVTPWYKHFINVFIAPHKMMNECFNANPPKGAGIGAIGSVLFSILCMQIQLSNPIYIQQIMQQKRQLGISEDMIQSSMALTKIQVSIGAVIGIFLGALIMTAIITLIRLVLKDKAKFGMLYRVTLLGTMVMYFVECIDSLIALKLGMMDRVFCLTTLLGIKVDILHPTILTTLMSLVSLQHIWNLVIIGIGYKVVAHTTVKKSVALVVIYESLVILFMCGAVYLAG